jgi:hypothetical protein
VDFLALADFLAFDRAIFYRESRHI